MFFLFHSVLFAKRMPTGTWSIFQFSVLRENQAKSLQQAEEQKEKRKENIKVNRGG